MLYFATSFILFLLFGYNKSSNLDDTLPVYMKGLNWSNVQEYLKENLRLQTAVTPLNYAIELKVNVRGHSEAEKSDFNGTVTIYLTIIKPVDKIKLHSNGLVIEKAKLIERVIMSEPAGVIQISTDSDRETITIHVNRTIRPMEEFMLQITYRGVAKLDEYGLYEHWDPKFNKSQDSNGPSIIVSNNFPTGARFWFPCFDEPEMKATFEIAINHPSGLNAYSNTDIERMEKIENGRTLTVFAKTRSLSTYQVALSVNHLESQYIDVKGFGKVRLICSKTSHIFWKTRFELWNLHSAINDVPALLKHHLEQLANFEFGDIPKEKLDIIILEDKDSTTIQPGLITIGRSKLWNYDSWWSDTAAQDFRDLVQLRIGNKFAVRAVNQMWMSRMFSYFSNYPSAEIFNMWRDGPTEYLYTIVESSIHERPLRDDLQHSTTTKQFLASKMEMRSLKASHIFRLFNRYCPKSKEALQKYVAERTDGFVNIDDFIGLSKHCKDPEVGREFLEDFINQPGKAMLNVKRSNSSVIIEQTRYHSTYFDSTLRDNKTRYTIPIFFTIDGKPDVKVFFKNKSSVTIAVPESSLFLIDHEFDHLYFAFYEDIILPTRNITQSERRSLVSAVSKSMVAAVNIGFVRYEKIYNQLKCYVERKIFAEGDHQAVYYVSRQLILARGEREYIEDSNKLYILPNRRCEQWSNRWTTWNGLYNNETMYWQTPTFIDDLVLHLHCLAEWSNSTKYRRFLEENFLGHNTAIRPEVTAILAHRIIGHHQWRDLHRFFFQSAGNYSNHRFNLLADAVLNQARMDLYEHYPNTGLRDDYLKEIRQFILRNPRRAASMSTEIEMRLEREFVKTELPMWHNIDGSKMEKEFFALVDISSDLEKF